MSENPEEYVDLARECNMVCEFCSRRFTEELFLEHLSEHSKEDIEALKRLAELSLRDEEEYKALCWELIRLEYFERLKEGV